MDFISSDMCPHLESILADLLSHFRGLHDQGRIPYQEYTDLTGKITGLKEGNRVDPVFEYS